MAPAPSPYALVPMDCTVLPEPGRDAPLPPRAPPTLVPGPAVGEDATVEGPAPASPSASEPAAYPVQLPPRGPAPPNPDRPPSRLPDSDTAAAAPPRPGRCALLSRVLEPDAEAREGLGAWAAAARRAGPGWAGVAGCELVGSCPGRMGDPESAREGGPDRRRWLLRGAAQGHFRAADTARVGRRVSVCGAHSLGRGRLGHERRGGRCPRAAASVRHAVASPRGRPARVARVLQEGPGGGAAPGPRRVQAAESVEARQRHGPRQGAGEGGHGGRVRVRGVPPAQGFEAVLQAARVLHEELNLPAARAAGTGAG